MDFFNTVSKQPVALRSSASVNEQEKSNQNSSKTSEIRHFPGFFLDTGQSLGTLISNCPIALEKDPVLNNAYRNIDPENDWNYEGVESTLKEYMEKHPPKKERNRGNAR